MMLIDIDDFEMINAVHGRNAGDQYLLAFAAYLKETFDTHDRGCTFRRR